MTESRGPKPTSKAKASKKRKRKRAIRNIIVISVIALLIILVVVVGMLIYKTVSENNAPKAEVTTLTVGEDGSIVLEEVAEFNENLYDKAQLKEYTQNLIESFNDTYGGKAVKLDKLTVKDDQVYMRTTYEDAGAYGMFSSYNIYASSVTAAAAAGYDFNDTFVEVAAGRKLDALEIDDPAEEFADYNVVVIEENITVVVPGEITYVSSGNTKVVDSSTVRIAPDNGNVDSTNTVYIIYQ